MILSKLINRLRINSFLLFLFPTIAIVGSLLIHNILVVSNFNLTYKNLFLTDTPGDEHIFECKEDGSYCLESPESEYLFVQNSEIDSCFIYFVENVFVLNGDVEYQTEDIYELIDEVWFIKKNILMIKLHTKDV
jgi:hypothetical protein